MDEHSFDELLASYLEGTLSENEMDQLLAAVNSSPELRKRFQEETRLHVLLREAMSEQVEINLIQESVTPPVAPQRRWIGWFACANAAALLIICGWYFLQLFDSGDTNSFGTCLNVSGSSEVRIERSSTTLPLAPDARLQLGDRVICGEQARAMLRLNDGSILSLEKGTQLVLMSDRPEIKLERGAVLFEVAERAPDAAAFQVHTSQSTVDVMGTVFGLADDGQTDLEVYEGRVSMIRHRDKMRVEVGTQQSASTRDKVFAAQEIKMPARRSVNLRPSDDVTLHRGKPDPFGYRLRVEANRRVAYLRFVVPEVGEINSAILRLTQEIDTGSGKLQVHLGEHSQWDESSLTESVAPKRIRVLDQHRGVVTHGQVVELDVSDAIKQPGPLTLILTLNKSGENDIWFGSRKGQNPPQLILSLADDGQ